jgi:hypothetical protein
MKKHGNMETMHGNMSMSLWKHENMKTWKHRLKWKHAWKTWGA